MKKENNLGLVNAVSTKLVPELDLSFEKISGRKGFLIGGKLVIQCPISFDDTEIKNNKDPKHFDRLFISRCISAFREITDLSNETLEKLKDQKRFLP